MTTYFNVPVRERNEAKAKGARWDSKACKWFVAIDAASETFISWLPGDPAKLSIQDLVESANGVPLSQLLAGVATVAQRFRQGVWTTVEMIRVEGNTQIYSSSPSATA